MIDEKHLSVVVTSRMSVKRVLDLAVSLLALGVLAPVMLIAILFLQVGDPGPVFYRQTRVGQHGRLFTMLKLRTMYVGGSDREAREFNIREITGEIGAAPSGTYRLASDPRIVPFGSFVRKFSVDEIPQLINVLRGEMSVVGPRPCLPWEYELFSPRQRRRQEVPPGLTGLWQVSGRNRLSITEMVDLDLMYLETASLWTDLVIICKTLPALLRAETA